jgi:hypothetical protein
MEIHNKSVMLCCLLAALCSSASAYINCEYDETPVFFPGKQIYWYCETSHTHCVSYVSYEGNIYQANPERTATDHVGVIDKFEVNNKIVRPHFTMENLRPNRTVTFGVFCSNESFEAQVRPAFLEPDKIFDFSQWFMANIPYFILGFVVLLLAGAATYTIVRARK